MFIGAKISAAPRKWLKITLYQFKHKKSAFKENSKYDQEIPQSQTAGKPVAPRGKSHDKVTRHQEDKLSKATGSLFPFKIIAKLEWTQRNAQQNIKQLQNPTMGETNNNESTTTTEPLP